MHSSMFKGKTAWFSKSCGIEPQDVWVRNGGKLENQDLAQFIFSDSWHCGDTRQLLESEAYLYQHLAVFQSQYVVECSLKGVDSVTLGDFFMAPTEMQDILSQRNTGGIILNSSQPHAASPKSKNHSAKEAANITDRPTVQAQLAHETPQAIDGEKLKAASLPKTQVDATTTSMRNNVSTQEKEDIPHVKTFPKFVGQLKIALPGTNAVPYFL